MKQLLLNLDDKVYDHLKERARREHRSTGALIIELLRAACKDDDDRL